MRKIVIDRQELRKFLSNPQAVANFESIIRACNTLTTAPAGIPPEATDLPTAIALLNFMRADLIAKTS